MKLHLTRARVGGRESSRSRARGAGVHRRFVATIPSSGTAGGGPPTPLARAGRRTKTLTVSRPSPTTPTAASARAPAREHATLAELAREQADRAVAVARDELAEAWGALDGDASIHHGPLVTAVLVAQRRLAAAVALARALDTVTERHGTSPARGR